MTVSNYCTVFFPLVGPIVSKGVDGDLSAYIPGKKTNKFCYKFCVVCCLWLLCLANKGHPYYVISGGGGVSALSMHATAGSDLTDDFDNLSHDPLQSAMTSDRGFASSNVETFLPPRWNKVLQFTIYRREYLILFFRAKSSWLAPVICSCFDCIFRNLKTRRKSSFRLCLV